MTPAELAIVRAQVLKEVCALLQSEALKSRYSNDRETADFVEMLEAKVRALVKP